MNHANENRTLVSMHAFKTNTSKERPVLAGANGRCEKCGDAIEFGTPICWHRRFGVFHANCYKKLTLDSGHSGDGLSESDVRGMIDDALKSVQTSKYDDAPLRGEISSRITAAQAELAVRVQTLINDEIAKRVKPQAVDINVSRPETKSVATIKNAHRELATMLFFVGRRKHVYLYGPPGSGKSTAAKIVADSLGLAYGYTSLNPQTPDSRLIGYMDANGRYVESVLFRLYKNGGVFCIDEMDNASASLLTTLNSLLENGIGSFPCGNVDRHPDFICVATGNTAGRGGTAQFPERRPFDAAFAERFKFIAWPYDENQERTIALGINPKSSAWIDWVQKIRAWAIVNDPQLVISPRATFEIADALVPPKGETKPVLAIDKIVECCLWKGIETERSSRIVTLHPFPVAA